MLLDRTCSIFRKRTTEAAVVDTVADVVLALAGDDAAGVVTEYERLTWGEVVQQAADRAAFLSGMRAGRQVHAGVLLDNVPDYLFWTCAAALAGDIRHTDCDLIVTEDRLAGLLCDRDHGGLDHGVPPARLDPRAHQRCVAIEQRCRHAPRSRAAHSWTVTTACVRRRRCMRVWVT
jgi:hypothetical protein